MDRKRVSLSFGPPVEILVRVVYCKKDWRLNVEAQYGPIGRAKGGPRFSLDDSSLCLFLSARRGRRIPLVKGLRVGPSASPPRHDRTPRGPAVLTSPGRGLSGVFVSNFDPDSVDPHLRQPSVRTLYCPFVLSVSCRSDT